MVQQQSYRKHVRTVRVLGSIMSGQCFWVNHPVLPIQSCMVKSSRILFVANEIPPACYIFMQPSNVILWKRNYDLKIRNRFFIRGELELLNLKAANGILFCKLHCLSEPFLLVSLTLYYFFHFIPI